MDVIPGIFGEKEINAMDDETLALFSTLVDDKVASVLNRYLNNPEACKETVGRIRSTMGDAIDSCSFHLRVIDSGILEWLRQLSLTTLAYTVTDLDAIEEKLNFLRDNKSKLKSYIEPRSQQNYKQFLQKIKELDKQLTGKPRDYPMLTARVSANKEFFCSSKEKSRPTRIGLVINKTTDWEMALSGIRFLKHCNDTKTADWARREF